LSLWTDLLGGEVRFAETAQGRVRYLAAGEGDAVVLLHGRGGHLETFARNLGPLSKSYRVTAIDLAGHGLSDPIAPPYTIERLAAHMRGAFSALLLTKPHVVGQSLGAWVAAHMALEDARFCDRLVLIEPAGLMAEEERLANPKIAEAYKKGGEAFETPTREAVAKRMGGLVADPASIDDELLDIRTALYQPEAARAVHKAVRNADNSAFLLTPERLRGLEPKTLFIRGAQSNTPESVTAAAVAACRDAKLAVVPGKQWPQFESPDTVNSIIKEFIG